MLIDANILIYAIDSGSIHHCRAKEFVEEALREQIVHLPWQVLLAVYKITTSERICKNPSAARAIEFIDNITSHPNVLLITESDNFWNVFRRLLTKYKIKGNLSSDTYLCALAIDNGSRVIATHDTDFKLFGDEIKSLYPLVD